MDRRNSLLADASQPGSGHPDHQTALRVLRLGQSMKNNVIGFVTSRS
jgi:hypothetical protein